MARYLLRGLIFSALFVTAASFMEDHNIIEMADLYSYLETIKAAIDALGVELNNLGSDLQSNINNAKSDLEFKINITNIEMHSVASGLNAKLDTVKNEMGKMNTGRNELKSAINALDAKVQTNKLDIVAKIDTAQNETLVTMSDLNAKVESAKNAMAAKVDSAKSEMKNAVGALNGMLEITKSDLSSKMGNAQTAMNSAMNTLNGKVENAMADLSWNIDTARNETNTAMDTLNGKMESVKNALEAEIKSTVGTANAEVKSSLVTVQNSVTIVNNGLKLVDTKVAELKILHCPSGWHKYSDSCFFVPLWKATWTGAQKICERLGGYLAAIESSGENNAIVGFLTSLRNKGLGQAPASHFWIGGNDMYKEGSWAWVSGNTVSYSHWQSGYPGRSTSRQCMTLYHNGYWYDAHACHTAMNFICEADTQFKG